MSQDIIAFISPISGKNHPFVKGKSVNHGDKGADFISLTAGLNERVNITPPSSVHISKGFAAFFRPFVNPLLCYICNKKRQ